MPALPTYIVEPIWEQFVALLPAVRRTHHPLGCHRAQVACSCCYYILRFTMAKGPDEGFLKNATTQN